MSTTTTATVPATQKATTMSDLIPQSAIDAALKRAEGAVSESMQFINSSGEVVGEIPLPQSGSVTELGNGSTCECCDEVDRLSNAIAAVLELHQPYITRSAWQTCNECWNSGIDVRLSSASVDPVTGFVLDIVYPCPTVAAIQAALGEGEK